MKKLILTSALALSAIYNLATAAPANYKIDIPGAHASINFKIQHLGYSFLTGRFDKFDGSFVYDNEDPSKSTIEVTIDTASVNSNHTKRDDHLRSEDFLFSSKFPQATFKSTKYVAKDKESGQLFGLLTLRGVEKEVVIDVTKIGEGDDPWGGYRVGFEGNTSFKLKDFGIPKNLGPKSEVIELNLQVEGIRQ